ncbi:Protein kinase-like domain protein [Tolypocladium capitatum]|uniref:Protein kinase-like domain protein n=1 Tax=Tolypocladium capitatum TaxID=45235 RepID=A0A2K3QBB5_9HYPO|nr:Protein kinase-like domain protein [Tolypocladium capitatum]
MKKSSVHTRYREFIHGGDYWRDQYLLGRRDQCVQPVVYRNDDMSFCGGWTDPHTRHDPPSRECTCLGGSPSQRTLALPISATPVNPSMVLSPVQTASLRTLPQPEAPKRGREVSHSRPMAGIGPIGCFSNATQVYFILTDWEVFRRLIGCAGDDLLYGHNCRLGELESGRDTSTDELSRNDRSRFLSFVLALLDREPDERRQDERFMGQI